MIFLTRNPGPLCTSIFYFFCVTRAYSGLRNTEASIFKHAPRKEVQSFFLRHKPSMERAIVSYPPISGGVSRISGAMTGTCTLWWEVELLYILPTRDRATYAVTVEGRARQRHLVLFCDVIPWWLLEKTCASKTGWNLDAFVERFLSCVTIPRSIDSLQPRILYEFSEFALEHLTHFSHHSTR